VAYSTEQLALYRRISLRVAPLALLLYLVAFLDRVNVSFAALTMNHDLGLSEATYGLAAGVFFLGYMVLAIPSNYMIVKVGAPRWVAVLMITWGIVGCATAFVHGAPAYITLRFLLGAAESGFLPGIVYYLTRWLPGKARAGILALLYLAIPLSSVIGSPISSALLRMNGVGGLHGWQWLFLMEAIPAIILGCAVPWLLDAGPETATWLSDEDKQMLQQSMEEEASATIHATGSERAPMGLLAMLAATYFMLMIGLYELGFWTPRLIASHGVSLRWLGWLNALPYAVGAITLLPWCRWSDRIASRGGGRRWILAASFLSGCAGFLMTAFAPSLPMLLVAISIASFGVYVSMPIFWAGVSQRISPAAVAFAIALINSIGNIGGFLGPYATGWLLDRTHSYVVGLSCTAAALLIGTALVLLAFRKDTNAPTLS